MITVIVVGAGAAGLMAAGRASENADKVILIEKNDRVGKKLLITGKGRCNLTNSADTEDMISSYPRNGKFLYSPLYTFSNYDITELMERYGVKTKVERGGRVFPVSDKASDVVDALKKYALKDNVTVKRAAVRSIIIKDGAVKGVKTSRGDVLGDRVIICTGGKSYPATGSDGSGYEIAKRAGHTVTELRPSLIPIVTEEKWVKELAGLSLRNVRITAYDARGAKVFSDFGEMLFTHFGISGPLTLSMSAHLRNIGDETYKTEIDMKTALDDVQLDARIKRDFEKYNKKHFINSLNDLLPNALIPVIVKLSGIDAHKPVSEITRAERAVLVRLLKHLTLTAVGTRPIEEAIVTSGGVSINEINPSTMESKIVKGLYFAGEIIDVDGYTGGFNLQAAFSTGYLAGENASQV